MKKFIIPLILAVVLVPSVFGQTVPSVPSLTSPSDHATESLVNAGTYGLFGTDVDAVQDVNDYDSVEIPTGFGYAGAGTGGTIAAGYAKDFGNFFLGFFYDGVLWDGSETTTKVDDDRADSAYSFPDDTGITFNNAFGVLFGNEAIGGLKLYLSFNEYRHDEDKDDIPSPGTSTITDEGSMDIGLIWGKNFGLSNGILKPEVEIGTHIDLDKTVTDNGSSTDTVYGTGTFAEMSLLGIRLGADYESEKGNATGVFSVFYSIGFGLWPSKLSDTSGAKSDGFYFVVNDIDVGYSKTYKISDRWSAGYGFGTDLLLVTSGQKKADFELVGFVVSPHAETALIYNFAAKPFSLNAGIKVETDYTTVTGKYTGGSDDVEVSVNEFSPLDADFSIGGTLRPTQSFSIDMSLTSAINNFRYNLNISSITIDFLLSLKI